MSQDEGAADAPQRRPIKSFVLRQGRITEAQRAALEALWPRYGLDWPLQPADALAQRVGTQPLVMEIGFGNGEALAAAAAADPARHYLGLEVHRPGVGRLLRSLDAQGTRNVSVIAHDAVEVLRTAIAAGTLDELRLYFPDPWPKARHHKRRIVQDEFVALVASRLRPGGLFHLATDWQAYAEHMVEVLERNPQLVNIAGPGQSSPRPAWRIETHFERRGLRLGHAVSDLIYRRR